MKLIVDMNLSPNWVDRLVRLSFEARAIDTHRTNIERGALLAIDDSGTRVRLLPLRHA